MPDSPAVVMAESGEWDLDATAGVVSLELSWNADDADHDNLDGYQLYLSDPAFYGYQMNRALDIDLSEVTVTDGVASFIFANDGTDEGNLLHPDTDYVVRVDAWWNPDNPGQLHRSSFTSSRFATVRTAATVSGAEVSNLRCERLDGTALASCRYVRLSSFCLKWDAPPSPVDHYEVFSYESGGDVEFSVPQYDTDVLISGTHVWDSTTQSWTTPAATYRHAVQAMLEDRAPGVASNTITITTAATGGV